MAIVPTSTHTETDKVWRDFDYRLTVNDSKINNNESDENGWKIGLIDFFFLMFKLDYSDFKINKMKNKLEWYLDKLI